MMIGDDIESLSVVVCWDTREMQVPVPRGTTLGDLKRHLAGILQSEVAFW